MSNSNDKIDTAIKHLTEMNQRKFAVWCARRCKTDVPEIEAYIDAIEAYYVTTAGTKAEMDAAERAAYGAADSAAAYGAAFSAAYWAAYWAADSAAHWAADWAAESKAQLRKLRAMIKQQERGAA